MFEAKMAGGVNDPDDLIVSAFKAFDEEVEEKIKGQMVRRHILEVENFKHVLTTFSDTLNEEEMDDIFGEFEFDDDGNVLTKSVVDLFVPGAMDEKEEEKEEEEDWTCPLVSSGFRNSDFNGDWTYLGDYDGKPSYQHNNYFAVYSDYIKDYMITYDVTNWPSQRFGNAGYCNCGAVELSKCEWKCWGSIEASATILTNR